MKLDAIDATLTRTMSLPQPGIETNSRSSSFLSYLNDALKEVNSLQKQAAQGAQKLALGDQDYLHNTMLAYEKASLALQLTIEIRNKLVEAYQEIMRIQL